MSVHFDVNKISFFGLDDWSVAVCAWRGCCIEVFSRAEHSVADCLKTLEAAGLKLSNDAYHQGAVARLRALSDCMSSHTFGGHEKGTRKRIESWQKLCEKRTMLAHGKVKATQNGITIEPVSIPSKKGPVIAPMSLSRVGMLEFLADLEQSQLLLHQQLGHIKALATKAKPSIATKQPDPGASPG
jgi:hypothetical protein